MNAVSIINIVKAFEEDKNILDGLSFNVELGAKVGILGKNGAGKTTLFRIIAGEIESDEGDVAIPSNLRVGVVAQIPKYPSGYTAEDVLKTAHKRIYDLGRRMAELEAQMQTAADNKTLSEYDRVSSEFARLGGYELDRLRNTVCSGLSIPQSQRAQLFDELSGGEKTRINLARLILEETDILLLDEPTNHLDMKAAEWLEDYLLKFKGTVLTISHDRYFLDKVVTKTIEIVDGKAEEYNGNYSFFVREKERRYEEMMRTYEKNQAKIEQLQKAADQMHLWAFMGNDKLHKRAFNMEKRIERLEAEGPKPPKKDKKLTASFSSKEFRGDEVINIKGLSKSFGDKTLFSDVHALMRGRERIALLGDNGSGKSTFLKILMNEEPADGGFLRLGPTVKAAYLPQIIKFEDPWRSVLDTLIYEENYTPQSARNRLGAFKFSGEDVFRPVSQLSGGEQSRLRLCILMRDDINLLILDEPTNHLDIDSRQWIEEAVESYDEALLFVSHDRYFINKFAERIWELEDGHFRDYPCGYEEYREIKARERAQAEAETAAAREAVKKNKTPEAAKEIKKLTPKNIEKKMQRLADEIDALEQKRAQLDKLAEDNGSDYVKLMEIEEEKSKISDEINEKYNQWEELSEM